MKNITKDEEDEMLWETMEEFELTRRISILDDFYKQKSLNASIVQATEEIIELDIEDIIEE